MSVNEPWNVDDEGILRALTNPLRVRILAMLHEQSASPVRLAELMGVPLGTVAYHVRTLNRYGLIELEREVKRRGAIEHIYRVNEQLTFSDEAWDRASPSERDAAIRASLPLWFDYVTVSAARGGFMGANHATRTMMRLDANGRRLAHDACSRLIGEIAQIEKDAAERLGDDPDPSDVENMCVLLLEFESVKLSDQPPPSADPSTHRRE